jgi:hypothetical protein
VIQLKFARPFLGNRRGVGYFALSASAWKYASRAIAYLVLAFDIERLPRPLSFHHRRMEIALTRAAFE